MNKFADGLTMNKQTLIALTVFLSVFFLACEEKAVAKKEMWALVTNFLSPDISNQQELKNFPFPDFLQFALPDTIFSNQGRLPAISDSTIIFYSNYYVNGERACCEKDTLELFSDSIKGKKYLFVIDDYITVFQSDSNSFANLRPAMNAALPLWGINLNTPYPAIKFKDEYEKLGARLVTINARFDEVSKQKWSDNDSISVETIQFNNSEDRIITALYKDMKEKEVDSTISYIRNQFPNCNYKEEYEKDSDGKQLKFIRIKYQGVFVSFTQVNATDYQFMITDYYATLKLIINNAGTGYVFRDDVKIY